MAEFTHLLEVYEPYDYRGTNPLHLEGVGVLRGGNGADYYLLEISTPITLGDEQIEQILLLPRYNGDPISNAQQGSCTVNIECVLPSARLQPDGTFTYDAIRHWGVGKITRCNGRR